MKRSGRTAMHVTAFALYGPVIGGVLVVVFWYVSQGAKLSGSTHSAAMILFALPFVAFGSVLMGLIPAIIAGFCISLVAAAGWSEGRIRWASLPIGGASTIPVSGFAVALKYGSQSPTHGAGGLLYLALIGGLSALVATLLTTGLRVRAHDDAETAG